MDEEKTDTENTGAEGSAPAEETKTEETTAEETKTEEAPAAEETKTEETPAAEETKTEEAPAETATAEAPAEQESPKEDSGDGDGKVTVPGFLKVLGILTFIGCGLQVLGALGSLTSLGGIISIASALLCFYGVLQMWKLKKMGFYIYLIGEIAAPAYTVATIGSEAFSLGLGGFMGIVAMLSMFFPVVFIILYALNLKHMK